MTRRAIDEGLEAPTVLPAPRFPKPVKREKKPKWMRAKSPRRIAKETPREKLYKQWIHGQQCVGASHIWGHHCGDGATQQSHLRDMTGLSLKAGNFHSVPMCPALHRHVDRLRPNASGYRLIEDAPEATP